jgi:hypothetical protein
VCSSCVKVQGQGSLVNTHTHILDFLVQSTLSLLVVLTAATSNFFHVLPCDAHPLVFIVAGLS